MADQYQLTDGELAIIIQFYREKHDLFGQSIVIQALTELQARSPTWAEARREDGIKAAKLFLQCATMGDAVNLATEFPVRVVAMALALSIVSREREALRRMITVFDTPENGSLPGAEQETLAFAKNVMKGSA